MMSRVLNARDICRDVGVNKKGGSELVAIQQIIEGRIKNFEDNIIELTIKVNSGKMHIINWELDVKEIEEQIKLDKKVLHEVQKLLDTQKRDLQDLLSNLGVYSEEELESAQRYTRY